MSAHNARPVEWIILYARERVDSDDRGVFRVDDEMIDPPLIAQAERIDERARATNPGEAEGDDC